jgi:hypothetical protein
MGALIQVKPMVKGSTLQVKSLFLRGSRAKRQKKLRKCKKMSSF